MSGHRRHLRHPRVADGLLGRKTAAVRVVYLPGMNGDGAFWAPVADRLAGFENVLVDWPGLGSVPASPKVHCIEDLVGLVHALLDEPAALVAQSMGGAVALRLALDPSAKVTHLVLCATSGGLDVGALGAVDWRPAYQERWPDAPAWAFDPVEDISARLAGVEVPTLLLFASGDATSPVAVGRHLETLLPFARLEVLKATEHSFANTLADEVAPLIEAHLRGA